MEKMFTELFVGIVSGIIVLIFVKPVSRLQRRRIKKFCSSLESFEEKQKFAKFLCNHEKKSRPFKIDIHLSYDDFDNFQKGGYVSIPNSSKVPIEILLGGWEIHFKEDGKPDYILEDRPAVNRISGVFKINKTSGPYQGWMAMELEHIKSKIDLKNDYKTDN